MDNGIRRGRPERSEAKKHAGGMFFSPGENPGTFDGIPARGCWQMCNKIHTFPRGFASGIFSGVVMEFEPSNCNSPGFMEDIFIDEIVGAANGRPYIQKWRHGWSGRPMAAPTSV